ncbi:pyrroloquinoline quinone biosynthesis protein PqqF [Serratia sp. NPDC078593]|uniref:pyrroloquinoline quinone biosynthesis protein PqqF n=1 Tax=unclassified Serratia (in: enterobacteria) TaxID=2647522 RepID=UPI0037CE27A2
MMGRQTASLQLANGLRINLHSNPADSRAAALIQINAGSYHEPPAWPGLAHLLEHMVFRGSERFPDQQRLISWIPSLGGRLNATTDATQTAYFFELDGQHLAAGVERLIDMLIAPLLAADDISQEVGVIDAEYRLLCTDSDTLCAAAQRHAFHGVEAMHRFHVGNRLTFAGDIAVLRHAIQLFHQRYYHASNMVIWLQGPQPLPVLRAMAETLTAAIPAAEANASPPPTRLTSQGHYTLILPGISQLRFTFALTSPLRAPRGWLRMFEHLLYDEAPGSLLAWLREHEYCDDVRLLNQRCAEDSELLTLVFHVTFLDQQRIATLESVLFNWLHQLQTLTDDQRAHYCQQANPVFAKLAPLEQLRANAYGLPAIGNTDDWQHRLTGLLEAPFSRLTVQPDGDADSRSVQGFSLRLRPSAPIPHIVCRPHFDFFPTGTPEWSLPALPRQRVALTSVQRDDAPAVLLLRPTPQTPLTDRQGYRLQSALRLLAAELAHQQGHLSVERWQGVWLLQLSADDAQLCRSVYQLNQALSAIPAVVERDAERRWQRAQKPPGELAIRQLLAELSNALLSSATAEPVKWQAMLYGGNQALHHSLAHLLSQFPSPIIPADALYAPKITGRIRLATSGDENALLLFYPLPENTPTARLALRLLAQLYAPRFFQRLRVERNIGYVVQCAFHRCADREGMLFALQSPHFSVDELEQFTVEFLQQMQVELAQLCESDLQQAKAALKLSLKCVSRDPIQQSREWLLVAPPAVSEISLLNRSTLLFWQWRLFFPQ